MKEISITRQGKKYTGHYQINGSMVSVHYAGEKKTTQLGGSGGSEAATEALAKTILGEMISHR